MLHPPHHELNSTHPLRIINSVTNPWNSPIEVNLIQSLTDLYVNNLSSSTSSPANQELYFQDEPEQTKLQHYLFSELIID